MKTAIIAITEKGSLLASNISNRLNADLFLFDEYAKEINNIKKLQRPFSKNIQEFFNNYDNIIFIMAIGIVVRVIAPYIVSKIKDPAIVVLDEKGNYIVSLLSGHIGGANDLAIKIAEIVGGQAVITTATDINNSPAADIIAKKNNCYIENIENLKYINGALARNEIVNIFTDYEVNNSKKEFIVINSKHKYKTNIVLSDKIYKRNSDIILYLRPKILVLGIGCKKNISYEKLETAIKIFMDKNNRSINSIDTISSINIKANEQSILEFCNNYNIIYKTFTAEQLSIVEYKFAISEFVKKTVGVGNVCETSAYLASNNGYHIAKKTLYDGITVALFQKKYCVYI